MYKLKKSRRRMETSKALLFSILVVFTLLEILVLAGWLLWDRADAAGLAGVFASPIGVVVGFYLWKAKNENIQKYGYKTNIGHEEDC